MKSAVSLSAFEMKSGAPVLFNSNLEENIPIIKEIGFDGVDLFVDNPRNSNSQQAKKLLNENGLSVGVVMPAVLFSEGLSLSSKEKEIRHVTVKRMLPILGYANDLNANVSLGLVRGNFDCEQSEQYFKESIEELLNCSEKLGVKLLIEPINRYEINNMNSSIEALKFIIDSKLPLYLMLDTFHMNIEDVDICENLTLCKDYIRHIHFLDSNRLAPGMGHIDMFKVFETLKKINYDGYLCLEALPKPNNLVCAKNGMKFFKKYHL